MPKLSKQKLTVGKICELSAQERAKIFEPIVKANSKQFSKLASTISETANFAKSFSSIASSIKLPLVDLMKDFKFPEPPQISDMHELPDFSNISLKKYDSPVTLKKSKWEIEKEAREAYMTELQIKRLEEQLNLGQGPLVPQYDQNTGIITFLGKKIEIPLNTNMEMICRIVLKNTANMKRKWSWDEIVESNQESTDRYDFRKIYTATRSINDKVAFQTQVKDFLITKPTITVQLNPQFLTK